MKYIKELDSLRAIAILLVIIGHWSPPGSILQKLFDADFGVNIFFVLSGFLITWILLTNRERASSNGEGKLSVIGNFYIRRTLRIFPIYYLCIIFFVFFPKDLIDDSSVYPWLFTYTTNLYFFIIQRWDGHISHLWSLAVEEQFYLLWPSVMLFTNEKYLRYVILTFIGMGVCCQFFFISRPMINFFTISCFSAFGAGAFLAYLFVYEPNTIIKFLKFLKFPAIVALVLIIFGVFQSRWPSLPMQRVLHSILALYTITYIILKREKGAVRFNFIWKSKVMILIGKISYGLYLYHGFVPFLVSNFMQKNFHFRPENELNPIVFFLFKCVVVFVVSLLSWMIIEKPLLSLKKHFEYNKQKNAKPAIITI